MRPPPPEGWSGWANAMALPVPTSLGGQRLWEPVTYAGHTQVGVSLAPAQVAQEESAPHCTRGKAGFINEI